MKLRYDDSLAQFLNAIPDKDLTEAIAVGERETTYADDYIVSVVQTGKALPRERVFPVANKILMYTPVYVWTKDWVYFMAEYDGNVWLVRVPRNPVDTMPEFSGEDIPNAE